jgi:hypothetical protein
MSRFTFPWKDRKLSTENPKTIFDDWITTSEGERRYKISREYSDRVIHYYGPSKWQVLSDIDRAEGNC